MFSNDDRAVNAIRTDKDVMVPFDMIHFQWPRCRLSFHGKWLDYRRFRFEESIVCAREFNQCESLSLKGG
ncbi:MAG: hypothetical protein CENE_00978 [Candidatus Celerinatantimonas neptuna]|nr:MAG: hypothetical protein CENE_00978 [Candidatus Celerinatantimonas neptuna]